jgi:hypothetical protein
MNTFYRSVEPSKRKELRLHIEKVIKLRKEQREIFERTLIAPLTNNIRTAEKVLRNEIPIEHYVKDTQGLDIYLKKWFGVMKHGN